jgi:hypothetical protein
MGSDRPGVHAARNGECESIARRGVSREAAGGNLETDMGHCTPSGIGDRGDLGGAARRSAEGLKPDSSSHRQARLRRPRGSRLATGPMDQKPFDRRGNSDSLGDVRSSNRSVVLGPSGSSCEPVISPSLAARPAAPHRGHRAEPVAAAGGGAALDLADGAAGALRMASCSTGARGGHGDIGVQRAANDERTKEHGQSEPRTGAQQAELEASGRTSAGIHTQAKRRRIRGKQTPPPWESTAGAITSGENSMQVACSAGPSRSAYLHSEGDRRAACGDRHGQALESSSAATAGAGGARGAYADDVFREWSTWRGRPPGAG